jgi:hypothetical protein
MKRNLYFATTFAWIVERNVDGSALVRSFASPAACLVFGEAGDIGAPSRLDAGFRLALGKAVWAGGGALECSVLGLAAARVLVSGFDLRCASALVMVCGGKARLASAKA